jgi:hypothetical protein
MIGHISRYREGLERCQAVSSALKHTMHDFLHAVTVSVVDQGDAEPEAENRRTQSCLGVPSQGLLDRGNEATFPTR